MRYTVLVRPIGVVCNVLPGLVEKGGEDVDVAVRAHPVGLGVSYDGLIAWYGASAAQYLVR